MQLRTDYTLKERMGCGLQKKMVKAAAEDRNTGCVEHGSKSAYILAPI